MGNYIINSNVVSIPLLSSQVHLEEQRHAIVINSEKNRHMEPGILVRLLEIELNQVHSEEEDQQLG